MSSFRFVHAAHLHLDAPARGVEAAPPAIRAALRDAALIAWERVVRLAIEHRAEFVLLAGGLFDAPRPTARARAALVDGLRKLAAERIATFIALGEEDAADERLSGLAPAVHVFDAGRASALPVVRDGVRLATLHGMSSTGSDADVGAARRLRGSGAGLHVALWPGASPFIGPEEADGIAETGIDYWGVGQSHEHARLRERPWLVQSGTTQGRASEAAEVGPKGALLVEAEGDRVSDVAFVELDAVRFHTMRIDVSELRDGEALLHDLESRREAEASSGARTHVIDAILCGEPADPTLDLAPILSEMRRRSNDGGHAVWWSRLRAEPASPRRDAGRLASVVRARANALAAAPLPRSSFLAQRLEPLRQVWDGEIDLSSASDLLHEASALAVEGLATEALHEDSKLGDSNTRSRA